MLACAFTFDLTVTIEWVRVPIYQNEQERKIKQVPGLKWVLRFWPIWILKWVHLVCTLIDWSQHEGKKTLVVSSFCASHPRDATRRISATLQPSTQMVVSSSSRPSSRCCCQHLKNGRELLLLRSVSSVQQATTVSRDDERSTVFFFSKSFSLAKRYHQISFCLRHERR